MESLVLESSVKTPQINFDPSTGNFQIEGISVPEDTVQFYTPVIEWLQKYVQQPASFTKLIVRLAYLNTSSLQAFYEIFAVLAEGLSHDSFSVEWHYIVGDSDMKEIGEDFKDALEMDIKLIAVETA